MNGKNKVAILMATYNGEEYIDEQIESILLQEFKDYDLIIRDDGSTDSTFDILKKYALKSKNIFIMQNNSKEHGQLANFSFLFDYAKEKNYEYIMFSDQDDIWLPNKVSLSLKTINQFGRKPILLYTNYLILDQYKRTKKTAFNMHFKENFESIFVQNWIMGCTMMLNKEMIKQVEHIPLGVDNHDYWIALVASLLEKSIIYVDVPTMIHRLHNNNVTTRSSNSNIFSKAERLYTILFNSNFRKQKMNVWTMVEQKLAHSYTSNHICNLANMLQHKGIYSVALSLKYRYKGMNYLSSLSFYTMLLLH